jgi:hypothetical protein
MAALGIASPHYVRPATRRHRAMTQHPTDQQLAAAVERIVVAVHEALPKLKVTVPGLVRILTDEEWVKLRDDEEKSG